MPVKFVLEIFLDIIFIFLILLCKAYLYLMRTRKPNGRLSGLSLSPCLPDSESALLANQWLRACGDSRHFSHTLWMSQAQLYCENESCPLRTVCVSLCMWSKLKDSECIEWKKCRDCKLPQSCVCLLVSLFIILKKRNIEEYIGDPQQTRIGSVKVPRTFITQKLSNRVDDYRMFD